MAGQEPEHRNSDWFSKSSIERFHHKNNRHPFWFPISHYGTLVLLTTTNAEQEGTVTVREYATHERISLGTAYRRLWEGRVPAMKRDGCWVVSPEAPITTTVQGAALLEDSSSARGGKCEQS
jgi:hypothetical protein